MMGRYEIDKGCSGIYVNCATDGTVEECHECILDRAYLKSRHDLLLLLAEHKVFNEGEILAAILEYSIAK